MVALKVMERTIEEEGGELSIVALEVVEGDRGNRDQGEYT
jgi:hypothetical protein